MFISSQIIEKLHGNNKSVPEKRLWAAVVLMMIADTQRTYDEWHESLNGISEKLRNELVKLKITATGDRVEMICEFLEIDHSVISRVIFDIADGKRRVNLKDLTL